MKYTRPYISLGILLLVSTMLFAAVPPMINYQGKLTAPDGKPVTDGTYAIRFAIYDLPTGGTPLWSEPNPTVQVKSGLFSVLLGSVVNLPANLFDSPNRFFGVQVGSDAEMTPRQQIGSVPFAVKAGSADTAITANQSETATIATTVVDGSITSSKLADAAVTAAKIAYCAIGRNQLLDMNGIVWKVPTYWNYTNDGVDWRPDVNTVWDISSILQDAGVPNDAQLILVGIGAPFVSDTSIFELQNAAGNALGNIRLSADIPQLIYPTVCPLFNTPVAIPGATRKIRYVEVGGYTASYQIKRRSLSVYGWR